MRFSLVLGALLLAFAGSTFSKSSEAIQLDVTKGGFPSQQDTILKAINTDVEYSEISPSDRALVNQSLVSVSDLLKDGSFGTLQGDAQQQLLTTQKVINNALLQAKKDSRMICKREMVLGSKLDKKVCRTAASLKRENDQIRDATASGTSKIK